MKLSWDGLKISIAGAKLSHLVKKDQAWDHGSMTEQVKNIFYQVEKASSKKESDSLKKYVTEKGLEQINQLIQQQENVIRMPFSIVLTEISIINVNERSGNRPDRFTALIKVKRKATEEFDLIKSGKQNFGIENFSDHWYFIRQREWWLLNNMKSGHSIFK
jgi:hypothetical protein